MSRHESFLILGGAGLVGLQIAREITKYLNPKRIVIAALYEHEVQSALRELQDLFPDSSVQFEGVWGNIFVRQDYANMPYGELVHDRATRQGLYNDLFDDMTPAYDGSYLAHLIRTYQPDVVIDSINTATAISYQDSYTATKLARQNIVELVDAVETNTVEAESTAEAVETIEMLMLSQSLPQLVRHVQLLYQALLKANTRLYLKIGTTGTGGMGLNIPYTHSEDRPSMKLMTKTAVAFAHTGLLFLMARTAGGPIVKELKPGAMIGYADVLNREIRQRGKSVPVYNSHAVSLNGSLTLNENVEDYEMLYPLEVPVVDTGENGLFAKGEFEAITALRQMEFITPEEIARKAMLEIKGSNTGFDVIAEIDSAVMNPTYRAGYLRQRVLEDMNHLEQELGTHSVALGMLGPPEIGKLLWEAELLKVTYGTLQAVLEAHPESIAQSLNNLVHENDDLRHMITSVGIPLLSSDGKTLLRGPFIRIPEVPESNCIMTEGDSVDKWANKGWVDLRVPNFERWQERFRRMQLERERTRGRGSASITRQTYLFDDIRIGEIVGWIFNNEIEGYRIK